MVQIDNKKMWESLIRQSSLNAGYISVRSIKEALKDQGLKYKDGEIVSIEPEPLKIEKDKWYMCIKDFLSADGILYKKGVCYQSDGRGAFKNEKGGWMANWSLYGYKYFRHATEEEIPSAFEQKIQPGDKEDAKHCFPELKESEDERIRKDIISYLKSLTAISPKTWIAWLEKQKVLTTEEDLIGKEDVLWCIKQAKKYAKDENEMGTCWFAEKWLEKQGEQNPAAWSEEDEYCIHQLIVFCENCMVQDDGAKRCAQWIKFLRPQKQWKPSDEQMSILWDALCTLKHENYKHLEIVKSLYQDLKKLREK